MMLVLPFPSSNSLDVETRESVEEEDARGQHIYDYPDPLSCMHRVTCIHTQTSYIYIDVHILHIYKYMHRSLIRMCMEDFCVCVFVHCSLKKL